jgi:SNF2 family DNA or RNA helicase
LSSAVLDLSCLQKKSVISAVINKYIRDSGLEFYLDDVSAVKSSRITNIIETVKKCSSKKMIVFSSFRSFINLMKEFMVQENIPIYVIESYDNMNKRTQVTNAFEHCTEGVLLTTYQVGAEGLNLQFCDTVLLSDFWWNCAVSQQAIARINRFGQKANQINVYFFTSNTAIENAILKKQETKKNIINSLMDGTVMDQKVAKMKIKDILKIITTEENTTKVRDVYFNS